MPTPRGPAWDASIPVLAPSPPGEGDRDWRQAVASAARGFQARPVTIVVNDPQRATATEAALEALRPALSGDRRLLVATGTHRFPPAVQAAFGRRLQAAAGASEVAWHDCRSDELVEIAGEAPWRCHRWLADPGGAVLAIGSSEPHYFAGITGAHKTVTIGCAAFEDVQANHAHSLSPASRPGRLDGNPVHDGIAAMARGLLARRPIVCIDLLQVGPHVLAAETGDPLEALGRIAPAVRSTYFRRIDRPADALILEAEGVLARTFYQADKAIKNSEWAVRDGGCLVLKAGCEDGVGPDDFMTLLRQCPDHASALAAVERRGYRLGDHKAVKLRRLTDVRGVRVFVVGSGLSDGELACLGFRRARSEPEALEAAGVDPAVGGVYRVADAANTCVEVAARPDASRACDAL